MAKTTITSVSDDIDETPDAQTVTFGFQGVAYSIDLSQKNLDKLTKALAPFIERATKQRGRVSATARKTIAKPERGYEISELREWAAKKKIDLPQRGRIPAAVIQQ